MKHYHSYSTDLMILLDCTFVIYIYIYMCVCVCVCMSVFHNRIFSLFLFVISQILLIFVFLLCL